MSAAPPRVTLVACPPRPTIALGRGWAGADRPPLSVRLLARVRAHGLDRRLAVGAAPHGSPLLARRAAVIVGRSVRAELADDLERILALAATGEPRRLGAVPVRRHEVMAAARPLRRLIAELRARARSPRAGWRSPGA